MIGFGTREARAILELDRTVEMVNPELFDLYDCYYRSLPYPVIRDEVLAVGSKAETEARAAAWRHLKKSGQWRKSILGGWEPSEANEQSREQQP